MKKIIIILVFLAHNLLANNINITLVDFADVVSKQNNINIIIDETIDTKISLLIPDKISNKDLYNMFKTTISKHKFNLNKSGKTYYLSKKLKYSLKSNLYHLKYNSFKDCEAILKVLGVPYTYLNDLNSFIITSTAYEFDNITALLDSIDVKQNQVMLKFTIFEYTDDSIKERGVQYASIFRGVDGGIEYALNAIVAPLSTSNPTFISSDFYAALRFLNEDKSINVRQNPFIIAKNNKPFKFEAVENIPYLVTTTTTQATNTSEQNSIQYKDVGLKINGRALIHDTYITLDLDLIIEDLLPTTSNVTMPETYKRVLKTNTDIQFNKVLLLTGLKLSIIHI